MTNLSVNINKVALIRNSRGSNLPNVVQVALDCVQFGAQGITVHPRPDGRHIRKDDVYKLKEVLTVEFNIEGYPTDDFLDMVIDVKPAQCTLVPDPPNVLTSNEGWDTIKHQSFLKDIITQLTEQGIRVSLFVNPDPKMVVGAKQIGAHRVELYTGTYAYQFESNPERAIQDYVIASHEAHNVNIGLNAGHDLNLHNLAYFRKNIPNLLEVSIGHALISDALYLGLKETIRQYLECLR
jgi:pyridoxine 5-phosphate synthase